MESSTQPLVPFYGTNPQQPYNNYGFHSSQPQSTIPPTSNSSSAYGLPANMAFTSPPAPSWQEIQSEFGPNSGNTAPVIDLLDDQAAIPPPPRAPPLNSAEMIASDHQFALRLAAQLEKEDQMARARHHHQQQQQAQLTQEFSSEIVASQEQALAQARRRNSEQRSYNTVATMGSYGNTEYGITSTSTALVVPMQVPRSSNPTGSDAIHPSRPEWKQSRGTKTACGATTGAILGGVAFGPAFPVGMVLGGAAGGYAANKLSKTGERRAQRNWEQANFQRGTEQSLAVSHDAPLV